ncbi:MAG: NAD(P)-dependent alcohol dehydrogenase [Bacteroidetes bacterium]|nr:NAD(P)-dependent alcohol dehydrogenase [Bacteroidota bacterium]
MKAYYSTKYGGPEYAFYGELPDATAKKGELLIEVKAVSINPVDYKIMQGAVRIISGSKFPRVFGTDFAGIVKEITEGVNGFKPGDNVYGSASIIFGKQGALSELMSVLPDKIRLIPEGMSFEEASSLPVAGLTALNGLRRCNVDAGSRVLINGGTGGVGHFAVQIAKAKGAQITATCSSANSDLAKKLGADEVSGYTKDDFAKLTSKFDAIFDASGLMSYSDVLRLLKKGGVHASTLFFPPSSIYAVLLSIISGRKLTSANMRKKPEDFEEMENLWREKKVVPLIDSTFPLSKCGDAFYHTEHGKPKGKVIVTI